MNLNLVQRGKNALDEVHRRVHHRMDLGPYALREHVGAADEYEHIPAEYLGYVELLGDLSATDAVLDVGCGAGGLAQALFARAHLFQGRYCGFDVDLSGGTLDPDTFRLPHADAEFDVAFAMSVFTRLLPSAAASYLQQIGRVLRPGGRALLSLVVMPREEHRLGPVAVGRLYRRLLAADGRPHGPGGAAVETLDRVRSVTAPASPTVTFYAEDEVRAMAEAGGLSVSSVRPGTWSGHGGPAFQDLVLLTRR